MKLYIQDVNQIGFNEVLIDNGKPIPVNLGIKDFTEITGSKNNLSFFSYTIDIPYEINAKALSFAVDLNVTSALDLVGLELTAYLEADLYTSRGFVKIESYEKQNDGYTLKTQFLGGIKNWVNRLPTYLRDLELGQSLYTGPAIASIYSNNEPYDGSSEVWYSLKHYDRFYRDNRLDVLDMKPDLYFAAIVKALSKASNTPIRSRFFATEYFRRWLFPYVGDGKVIYETLLADSVSDISTALGDTYSININDLEWSLDSDYIALPAFPLGQVPFVVEGIKVTVFLNLNISSSKTGISAVLTDELSNFKSQTTLKNGSNSVTLTGDFEGGESPRVAIEGDHVILAGSRVRIEMKSIIREGLYNFKHRSAIPSSVKTTDFISALSDLANLVWFYDEMNEQLIVEPKWPVTLPTGEYVPGFYVDLPEDYTEYIDCASEEGNFRINSDLKRNLTFAFKKDDEDKTPDNDLQWAHTETLTPKFPDGETKQENEVFAPTINKEILKAYGNAVVPYFIGDSEESEKEELLTDPGFDNAGAWSLSGGSGSANINSTVPSAAYFSGADDKTLSQPDLQLKSGQNYVLVLTIDSYSSGTITGVFGGTSNLSVLTPSGDGVIAKSFEADGQNFQLLIDGTFNITEISLYESEQKLPTFDFEPRVLYKIGILPYEWRYGISEETTTGVPIAAQVLIPSVSIPAGLPEYANLGFADYQGKPGIVSLFYPKDLEIYKYGVRKRLKLNLSMKHIADMERLFRYKKFVNNDTSGGGFHILENFQFTINKNQVTEVDLIAIP